LVVLGTIQPKRGRTCTTHLWSYVHDHLTKLFIIRWESLIFFSEMSRRVLLQGHELLRLGAWYRLETPNIWDTMGCPQVLDCSFGESVHPISIGPIRQSCLHPQIRIEIQVGQRIVLISLPQPAIICLLKIKKRNHQIQFKKIITYKRKWLNEHITKCWVRLSTNCCTSFWQSSLHTCVLIKSSIGLGSRPRDIACKKKMLQVKYIYK
jgi:hypothetical protein